MGAGVYTTSKQRRERILAEVVNRRHVAAKDLAGELEVSEATIRRDLRVLADEGRIELVYGGATLRRSGDFSFRSKSQRNTAAKRIIGELASKLVPDHSQLFVDSGTTCIEMAPFLKRRRDLSVIVNSARLALELEAPGISVILLGGQYRPDRMDTIGPLAMATLEQLRGYTCFIGADGLSIDFGLSAADIDSASLYRLAVRQARETVLLVDSSKFFTTSLFKIVDWDAISRVVTDTRPQDDWMQFLDSRGIQVIHPGTNESENGNPEP